MSATHNLTCKRCHLEWQYNHGFDTYYQVTDDPSKRGTAIRWADDEIDGAEVYLARCKCGHVLAVHVMDTCGDRRFE